MTIQRMLELLEIEHECMLRRAHDDCDRNCADCELVQDDYELHEMYTDVISLLKKQEEIIHCKDCIHWSEEYDRNCMIRQGWFSVSPDYFCASGERKEGGEVDD